MPGWLKNAVFYEIYPQSFRDSNGDGIGDFRGIEEKLGYLEALGVNAIWMNPCYESSFYDAGYDVKDHCKTASRYGTNDDLCRLFDAVHARGMHILLDLIPGHTAIDHPWFIESCKDEINEYTNRFIWRTGGPWGPQYRGTAGFLCGISERPGAVAVNCFSTQPALNFGFGKVTEDWQFGADSPEAEKTRLAVQDIMSFWLDLGCDGFRVDMAGSLVKEDEDHQCTIRLWQKVRSFLDENYPEAALISEWGDPLQALEAGFHMDFLLHGGPTHYMDLFRTEPYFSAHGSGDLTAFVNYYSKAYNETCAKGLICIPSGNHDMVRMRETLSPDEMKIAFAFLLMMPGCPFIYYGDEIGLPYMHGLKSKEGGYERTGSRTPMQWDKSINAGFSTAEESGLYLLVNTDPDTPDAATQMNDTESLWRHVHDLIRFRREHSALSSDAGFRFLSDGAGYPLVFERFDENEHLIIAFNPSSEEVSYTLSEGTLTEISLTYNGANKKGDREISLPPGSYISIELFQ